MTALLDSQVNDMASGRKKRSGKKAKDKYKRDEKPNMNHKAQHNPKIHLPVLLVTEQRRTQKRRQEEVVTKKFQCSEATTCSDKMDILLSLFHLQYLRGVCKKQSMVRRWIVSLKETLCMNTKGKGPL